MNRDSSFLCNFENIQYISNCGELNLHIHLSAIRFIAFVSLMGSYAAYFYRFVASEQ